MLNQRDRILPMPQLTKMRKRTKVLTAASLVVGLVVLFTLADVRSLLSESLQWIDSLGFWGPAIFMLIYVVACVLFIPGSILTLGAWALFGVVQGTVIVSIASTLGASLAFVVGRYVARGWVRERLSGNRQFAAIDRAVESEGWRIVGLTRLSPVIPFSLLNYSFGITGVSFKEYVLASWVGMLPATVLYVYVGSLFENLVDIGGESVRPPTSTEKAFYWAGLAISLFSVIYITKVAKRALKSRIEDTHGTDGGS